MIVLNFILFHITHVQVPTNHQGIINNSSTTTHVCYLFAIETAGTWDVMAIELTQIGRRITSVTEETRETTFLCQRLSMALQRGNAVSFQHTLTSE